MSKQWVKISEEKGGCYPHPTAIGTISSARSATIIYDLIGYPKKGYFLDSLATYKQGEIAYYYYEDQFDGTASDLFRAIQKEPKISETIKRKHLELGRKLIRHGEKIKQTPLRDYDNQSLAKILERQLYHISNLWMWGLTISLLEYKTPYISREIERQIKQKSNNYQSYLQLLLTPTKDTYFRKEKLNLLNIAREIKKDHILRSLFEQKKYLQISRTNHPLIDQISAHNYSFNWINYYYSGPQTEQIDHFKQITDILSQDLDREIQKIKDEFVAIRKEQRKAQKELGLDTDLTGLLQIARDFSFLKAFRKDALYHSFHTTDLLLVEIEKRFNFDLIHLRQMLPVEILDLVRGLRRPSLETLNARHTSCALLVENGRSSFIYGYQMHEEISRIKIDKISNTSELKGQIANLGHAQGKVKIINNASDLAKMELGDILVSIATNPTLVPAMRKAAAIVTDIGGITCHAAIVSRELGKPCVIGTRIATKILKDGDIVEVDAEHGTVKIIK